MTQETEQRLKEWATEAGLPRDSKFLSHWFGLTKADEGMSHEALPRPSPWNHFVDDVSMVCRTCVEARLSLVIRDMEGIVL